MDLLQVVKGVIKTLFGLALLAVFLKISTERVKRFQKEDVTLGNS